MCESITLVYKHCFFPLVVDIYQITIIMYDRVTAKRIHLNTAVIIYSCIQPGIANDKIDRKVNEMLNNVIMSIQS